MIHRNFTLSFVGLSGLLTLCLMQPSSGTAKGNTNWPGWRGPEGSGVSTETNLPAEWGENKNILWKTPIPGRGYSSPIVWDNRIFLTTAIEGKEIPAAQPPKHLVGGKEFKHPDWVGFGRQHTMKVFCLDRDSGKVVWEQTVYDGPVADYRHRRGAYAAPTPVTDGKYVFTYFGPEGIFCHDLKGKLIWKKDLGEVMTLGMGVGTSPVLYQDLLIIQADQNEGENSYIVAFNKKNGKEVWRVKRQVQVSWATPLLVNAGNRVELITSGNEAIIAYDPQTGKEYWHCKGVASNAIATPVAGQGLVIVSAGYPTKNIMAIRPGGSGDIEDTDRIVWRYNKGTSYVPSPILYGEYLYLMSDAGILTCIEVTSGRVVYEGGRVPVATKFYGSSPVAFDGQLLLTSDDGDTFVIKAGPKHEVIRTNSVGEPVRTSIAIADGRLFLRGEKHLFCIGRAG